MTEALSGQSSPLPSLDEPGDAELISAVRGGDVEAYGLLFERHVDAARRLARQLVSAGDVDDLVSEAFAKVLGVLQRGGGPDLAFRAYLLTSIRRLHVDKLRAGARLHTTDDMTPFDPGVPFEDTAVAGFENKTAAKAFAQLPERWQQVLWHTEVEGQKPADIAPLLGMSPNSVSALAYRAREGLRQAFISMHAQDALEDACATTRANLGAYIRNGISRRDGAKVEAHLQDCRACSAIYLELTEVNSNLGALLAPLILGSAAAGYLAAAGAGAKVGILLFLDRGRDWVLHNPAGRATAGVAAAGVVVAGIAVAATTGGDVPPPSAAPPSRSAAPSSAPAPSASSSTAPVAPPVAPPADSPSEAPAAATVAPTSAPTAAPIAAPTTVPTTTPVSGPVIDQPVITATAPPGGSVTIDLTKGARDADGDRLTVKSARLARPSHGAVVVGSGGAARAPLAWAATRRTPTVAARPGATTVTYTPDAGWRGTDTIVYVLTDDDGNTATGRVRVSTPNADPVADDDHASATLVHPGRAEVTVPVLANDRDANHDHLTVTVASRPTYGEARVNADGSVTYRSYAPVAGSIHDTFTYRVTDGHGGSDTATVTIDADVQLPENHPPHAVDDPATVESGRSVDIAVLSNDTDPDGDALTVSAFTWPDRVTRSSSDPNVLVYDAAGLEPGTYTFTYVVSDPNGATDTGSVTVVVTPAPEPPLVATDDFPAPLRAGNPETIDVLSNDVGTDLVVQSVTAPLHGIVDIIGGGTKVQYRSADDYVGGDSFSYTAFEPSTGRTATATVHLEVMPR